MQIRCLNFLIFHRLIAGYNCLQNSLEKESWRTNAEIICKEPPYCQGEYMGNLLNDWFVIISLDVAFFPQKTLLSSILYSFKYIFSQRVTIKRPASSIYQILGILARLMGVASTYSMIGSGLRRFSKISISMSQARAPRCCGCWSTVGSV